MGKTNQQVGLEPHMAATSAVFQSYVKRGLARIAAAALSSRPGAHLYLTSEPFFALIYSARPQVQGIVKGILTVSLSRFITAA